jgi:hypothetical protein
MFAIVAAILFGLALLLDLFNTDLGGTVTIQTIVTAGLLFIALHVSGAGTWRPRPRRRRL